MLSPVHTPVAFSSSPLTHVLPDPGKLANATAALFVALMKRHVAPGSVPPLLLQNRKLECGSDHEHKIIILHARFLFDNPYNLLTFYESIDDEIFDLYHSGI